MLHPLRMLAFAGLLFVLVLTYTTAYTNSTGAPSDATNAYSGSPKEFGRTCATSGCHPGQATPRPGMIATNIPASGYESGETYRITVAVSQPGRVRFGFQATVQDMAGNIAGTIALVNATDTRFVLAPGYITHTLAGSSGIDGQTWEFDWTAPGHMDSVYVFAAVNAANNDSNSTGDIILSDNLALAKNPGVSVPPSPLPPLLTPPSLVHDALYLTWHPGIAQEASVQVYHSSGSMVYRGMYATESETYIPAAHWARGMYLIEVVVEGNRGVYRMVKY